MKKEEIKPIITDFIQYLKENDKSKLPHIYATERYIFEGLYEPVKGRLKITR